MKKIAAATFVSLAFILLYAGVVRAQVTPGASVAVTAPTLYDQSGAVVDAFDQASGSLKQGWYYSATGTPYYYYANGAYYDPSSQSYGGTVLYPNADGPSLSSSLLTPGVPNTGVGGSGLTMTLALLVSAAAGVFGTIYLSKRHLI